MRWSKNGNPVLASPVGIHRVATDVGYSYGSVVAVMVAEKDDGNVVVVVVVDVDDDDDDCDQYRVTMSCRNSFFVS